MAGKFPAIPRLEDTLHKRIFPDFNVTTICSEAAEHCEGMIGRATRHACTPQVGIGPAAGNLGEGQPQIGIVLMGVVAHHIEAAGKVLPRYINGSLGGIRLNGALGSSNELGAGRAHRISVSAEKIAPYTRCKQGIKPAVDCNDGRAIFRRTPQSIARRGFGGSSHEQDTVRHERPSASRERLPPA